MSKDTDKLLAKGLSKGFAGGTVKQKTKRGSFDLESSHLEDKGAVYRDEWLADRAGGGQEIVRVGNDVFTRVYAGGTIPVEELNLLGISKKDVMVFLMKQIVEHGDEIRLYADYLPEPDGDWQYTYYVLDQVQEIPVTLGKEEISYKGQLVFVHAFVLSPVD